VVPVRIDPELKGAIEERAEADHTTTSEIIREALCRSLRTRGEPQECRDIVQMSWASFAAYASGQRPGDFDVGLVNKPSAADRVVRYERTASMMTAG
jgi:hypothetical protein